MWQAFVAGFGGDVAPGAFGGSSTAPLSKKELEYVCAMQRALPVGEINDFYVYVAQLMSDHMHRPLRFVLTNLQDPTVCAHITASLRPVAEVASTLDATQFIVDEKGFPVSSNDLWNKCVRGEAVTLKEIRANTDRIVVGRPNKDGTPNDRPMTCGDYHQSNVWTHPDHPGMTFKLVTTPEVSITLPEGYTEVKPEAVASN